MGSLSVIAISLSQSMLAMANIFDSPLYQASSSNIFNTASNEVATPTTVQRAAKKQMDYPESIRHFICQLLDAEKSSQTSIVQRLDESFNKTPEATGLGTLIRLPSEVRQQIWREVLKAEMFNASYSGSEPIRYMGGRGWHNALRRWKFPPLETRTPFETFNISVFRPGSYSVNNVILNMSYKKRQYAGFEEHLQRLTSHAVKGELEDLFLRNRIFEFECQEFLDTFLGQLSQHQGLQLRQISLVVFACGDCYVEPCWGRVIERLPRTINVVLITLDTSHAYTYVDLSLDQRFLDLSRKLIRKVLSAADILRNQILRQLPHARVILVGSVFDRLNASDRAAFESLSADKTWSNLDRKILV